MPNPKPLIIPREADNKIFAGLAEENEKNAIVLCLTSYGGLGAFRYRGRRTRSYVFRYDKTRACHTLRIPASVAMANKQEILQDIFDQRPMPVPVIPLVEPWSEEEDTGYEGPARNPHSQVPKELEQEAETPTPEPEEEPEPEKAEAPKIPANRSAAEILGLSERKPTKKAAKKKRAKKKKEKSNG